MRTILFFNISADERRLINHAIGGLSEFTDSVYVTPAYDDARARAIITTAQRAAGAKLRFLVIDTEDFVAGWGIAYDDIAFGGPFGMTA